MKVSHVQWHQAIQNLINRRRDWGHNDDNRKLENNVRDYKSHISKVFVGKTLLDVGCGACYLKECIPEGTIYCGIDAFPVHDGIIKGEIEDEQLAGTLRFETVCAFAMLDNCQDFDLAIENMKKIAGRNIVILTGIGIEPDQYHTFKLELEDFRSRFSDWKESYCEQVSDKVWLLEYTRP